MYHTEFNRPNCVNDRPALQNDPDDRLSFKEMCARFAVTPRTLRYYEYIELLAPERDGRSRFYAPREVARMKLILRAKRFGFSLEEIRQWLEIYERQGTEQQMDIWLEAAGRQIDLLKAQRNELDATIGELEELHGFVRAKRDWPRV